MSTARGAVSGGVRWWLRLEGLGVLAASVVLYSRGGHSWLLFAVLILAPDLGLLGYTAGPRIGAAAYNALHSYVGPLLLALLLAMTGNAPAIPLIWAAHIGVDRFLGFGLKYPSGFGDTHLGRMGRRGLPETGT